MLAEIGRVRQDNRELRRRWFCDDYFDLFVWQLPDDRVTGFQLCYDLPAYERVLSWRQDVGFSHHRIDSGEQSPYKNMTPIMVADGELPVNDVLSEFKVRAAAVDPAVRDTILAKLHEYGAEVDKMEPRR